MEAVNEMQTPTADDQGDIMKTQDPPKEQLESSEEQRNLGKPPQNDPSGP